MKTHSNAYTFTNEKGTVVTIGTFDGVHIGHKKIIARLTESAQANQWESVVLTFFPHPRMLLQKDADIKLINTIIERGVLLEKLGLDHLVVHPFTIDFSRMDAEDFVEEILVKALNAKKVIIGYDHRFGRNRTANIEDLKRFGTQFGFEVEEISKQELEDVAVSSTKIRAALLEGDIDKANAYLGYPIMLEGSVIHGKRLGRTLGYPTANLHISEDYKLIPGKGVYVVRSSIENTIVFGMMNIGTNPTVGGVKQSIETYFLDFDSDLYGKQLSIEILCKIREEQNFESVEVLIEAMKKDETFSRKYIQSLETQY